MHQSFETNAPRPPGGGSGIAGGKETRFYCQVDPQYWVNAEVLFSCQNSEDYNRLICLKM